MATHRHVMLLARPPLSGHHDQVTPFAVDSKHLFGSVAIELPVQPLYEVHRRRLGQAAVGCHSVYLELDAHMGCGLELQIAPAGIFIEVAGKRALDVSRARVMTLDEIAVVGVHDAHEVGEIGRRARMERITQPCSGGRQFGDGVRNCLPRLFQPGGLYALNGFDRVHFGRFFTFIN